MGRATYESIGHPLPERPNIVVTHQPNYQAPGCQVAHSVDEAVEVALQIARKHNGDEICIIGGGVIFEQSMALATKLHLTRIHATIEGGDAFFYYDPLQWIEISNEHHSADDKNQYAYTFSVLTKRK
nr:Dihydrofolate reductase [uncultured bacterium]